MLANLEKSKGWINLDEKFISFIQESGLSWNEYYEDEKRLRALNSLIFFDVDELKEFSTNQDYETPLNKLLDLNDEIDNIDSSDILNYKKLATEFNDESIDNQKEILKKSVIFYLSLLSSGFNYLALMLHGQTMCDLVSKAKDGDDDAYCKAVQIDRTVLELPYFRSRLLKAQLGSEPIFLNKLAGRIKTPVLSGKIRYRTLWITFAILDDEGLLYSLSHEEIFNICEEIGVYGKKFGVEDVGHISKRIREYRKNHRNSNIF